MKTSSIARMNLQTWRLAAITMAGALAMALPTGAFAANSAPTAVASISPTAVWEGDIVTLDASGSHTNPTGGPLDYQWQQQAPASPALLSGSAVMAVTATFTAPTVPLPALSQAVTFRVRVTDNNAFPNNVKNQISSNVTTTVYASPGADAEPKDAHVNEATLVQLTGTPTRTQPGAAFTYTWTAPAGITLSDIHAQNPTFTAPLVGSAGQALTFTLVVTEHLAGLAHDKDSAADSVTINVDNVNQPPTAYASANPNGIVSIAEVDENTDPVTLYGSGFDPDGDLLTSFSWTQVHDTNGTPLGQPGDVAVALSDNTSETPTFTAPDLTTQDHVDLVFQLTVSDGLLNSGPSYVTIRVNNTNNPPVAVPTATPASALEGDMVTLDGSASFDPNPGDTLTYSWVQVGTPAVTLVGADSPQASFVAPPVSYPNPGSVTLTFNLIVTDSYGASSDPTPISVTVSHKNKSPVAIVSPIGSVPEGSNACLDGSTSYDPEDGSNVMFAWVQVPAPGEPLVSLSNANTSGPCFDAPGVGPGGAVLHFQLTVTDSHGVSGSITVPINVTYVNHPPTAHAGADQPANETDIVHLSGSADDLDGNTPLTYTWTQVSGPQVTLSDPNDPNATFTAPAVACGGAVIKMRLDVDDGYGDVAPDGIPDEVNITIANVNHAPTAMAGADQNVSEGTPGVILHGDGSDADGEETSFQWTQIGGPQVTLNGSGQEVSFDAPNITGGDPNAPPIALSFRLTVTDTCNGSTTDDATVTVVNVPHDPMAKATGPGQANEGGDSVMLNGLQSSDPDGDPLTYTWTQTEGPHVDLDDATSATPSFTTPWVSANTPLKFRLTVSDEYGGTSSDIWTVTINNWHTPPDASHARADVSVLWPPDHKMALVHMIGLDNPNNDPVTIDTVTQDEPTNGLGDGDTPVDASISGDSVMLRAERSGNRDGRVYRVCFTIHDPEQDAQGCVNVAVPKSKKTDAAINSGGAYDSTH
jgi:K319L-like, PKD domain